MEDRPLARPPMKLRAGDKKERGVAGDPVGGREPSGIVFECGAFSRALLIVADCSDPSRLAAEIDLNRAPHSGCGVFFVRTRLGKRWASSTKPWSSRRGSTRSPKASPKPRTNRVIA